MKVLYFEKEMVPLKLDIKIGDIVVSDDRFYYQVESIEGLIYTRMLLRIAGTKFFIQSWRSWYTREEFNTCMHFIFSEESFVAIKKESSIYITTP